ncbi:hypothetical protein [Nonomuraea sp. NPDC003804]|uniref:hypothetical protein n=1 Tax=Nonomuraea sp. NPDC003804 TaxID=3154547 RepID=UPI0033B12C9E
MRHPLWASSVALSTALCLVIGTGGLIGSRFGLAAGAGASLLAATVAVATGLAAVLLTRAALNPVDVHDVFPEEER